MLIVPKSKYMGKREDDVVKLQIAACVALTLIILYY